MYSSRKRHQEACFTRELLTQRIESPLVRFITYIWIPRPQHLWDAFVQLPSLNTGRIYVTTENLPRDGDAPGGVKSRHKALFPGCPEHTSVNESRWICERWVSRRHVDGEDARITPQEMNSQRSPWKPLRCLCCSIDLAGSFVRPVYPRTSCSVPRDFGCCDSTVPFVKETMCHREIQLGDERCHGFCVLASICEGKEIVPLGMNLGIFVGGSVVFIE